MLKRPAWLVVLLSVLMLAWPAMAQDAAPVTADPPPSEWQDAIHSQIQAFRDHDATTALSFAAATFQQMYPTPEAFFAAIIGGGYSPIMESKSESFGPFKYFAPDKVYQQVRFVGNDQSLYEAIYVLSKEAGGWRVDGVQLTKTPGLGV